MRKTISIKNILIAIFSAIFFLCTMCSVAIMTKNTKVSAIETTDWKATSANGKVEVYQLAPNTGWLMNSYVIKTANGKLIVFDGGAAGGGGDGGSGQGAPETSSAYLPTALRAIAGVGENGYFEVEAWFITHAHNDHFFELARCLTAYNASSNYKVNNIYLDFPEFGTSEYPTTAGDFTGYWGEQLKSGLNNYAKVNGIATSGSYYDDLNGAVINAESIAKGLNITVDGVRFQILQTWDAADVPANNLNDTSLVVKMHVNDTTFLWLADAGSSAGARLTATYTTEELTCDYVQMAHHGQTGLTIEQYVAAGVTSENTSQKYLWPTPLWVWNNTTSYPNLTEVYNQANGTTTLAANANNIVACLYSAYPASLTSYADWANCIEAQKVASLDYEEVGFEVLGAQIRTQDPEGLRFVAQMTDATATKYQNAKMGMIFVTEELDTTQWLKVSADGTTCTTNDKAIVVSPNKMWDDAVNSEYGIADGYTAFSCVLLGGTEAGSTIPVEMYNKPITAVGFIIPESGEIIYTDRMTRSIGYMATVESMQTGYTSNSIVDKFANAVASDVTLSINGGETITSTKLVAPKFTVAGQDVSAADNVTYTSDDASVIKVVGNKVQALGAGTANVTATLSVGSKTVKKTVTVTTDVVIAPEGSWFYADFEDGTVDGAIARTSGSEIAVSEEFSTHGDKSLKITTSTAGLTANWNNVLYLANDGWTSTQKACMISLKLKYTLPSTVQSGTLILRMKDSSNWMEVTVTATSATYKKGPARSNISYDSTSGVLTMNACLTPESDGQNIEFATVTSGGGAWTIYVDEITFYDMPLEADGQPTDSWYYADFEAETYNGTFTAGGATLALTKDYAISGTQSLQITTSTAGEGAAWNNFFYFATTGWTQTENAQGEAVAHKVSFKMKATLPTGKTSGIVIIRMNEQTDYKTNGLEMQITSAGVTKVAGSSESTVSYDAMTGIISVEVYLTASTAGQNIQMATAGTSGGSWKLVIDEVAFFTVVPEAQSSEAA